MTEVALGICQGARGITKKEPPFYTDRPFTLRFIHVKRVDGELTDLSRIVEKIVSDGIEVIEMYDIETIDDLMRFELLKMLSLGTPFKKCKHCGCYFVPLGRSDMEYCPRVFKGENNGGGVPAHYRMCRQRQKHD